MQDPTNNGTAAPADAHPATQLEEQGCGAALVSVERGGKCPSKLDANGDWRPYRGWQHPGSATAEEIERTGANVGLLAAEFPALDVDVDDPELADTIRVFAADTLPGFSDAPVRLSRDSRSLHTFRAEEPFGKTHLTIENPDDKDNPYGVEWLADGQQYVVHGPHTSGVEYRWDGPAVWEIPPADLPTITREQAVSFRDALAEHLERRGYTVRQSGAGSVSEPATPEALAEVVAPGDTLEERQRWADEVADALKEDGRYGDYSAWQTLLRIIRQAYGPGLEAEALEKAIELSASFSNYDGPEAVERKWGQLGPDRQTMGFPVLLHRAQERGYEVPGELRGHLARAEFAGQMDPEWEIEPVPEREDPYHTALAAIRLLRSEGVADSPRYLKKMDGAREAVEAIEDTRQHAHALARFEAALFDPNEGLGRRGAQTVLGAGTADPDVDPAPSGEQLLENPDLLKPPPAVAQRMVYKGRASLLVGPPKVAGKSTLAAYITREVANGGTHLGEDVEEGHVLVVAPDESMGDTVRRLHGLGANPKNWDVLMVRDASLLNTARKLVEDREYSLVVFDSLQAAARLMLGGAPKSGDASGWSEVIRPMVDIAHDLGVGVLIIHHSRKSDGESRDSGEIEGAVDGIFTMRGPRSGEDRRVRHIYTRTRWTEEPYSIRLIEGEGYEMYDGSRRPPLRDRVLACIEEKPVSSNKIQAHTGADWDTLDDLLSVLESEEMISDEGNKYTKWNLTDKGRRALSEFEPVDTAADLSDVTASAERLAEDEGQEG